MKINITAFEILHKYNLIEKKNKVYITQQPLSGSPEGSPKSAEPTSDNCERCTKLEVL
jgi:hypothetical protein